MKLTHLAIAVSVALGLAACGGSDDNAVDNSANQPSNPVNPVNPVNPGGDDDQKKPEKKDPNKVEDPSNAAAATEIESRFAATTAANKQLYTNRRGEDTLAGYKVPQPNTDLVMEFQPGSTATKDILRASSITNYLAAGWVNDSSGITFKKNSIRLNPLQTYALGDDGKYYRIEGPTTTTWDNATPSDKFTTVTAGAGQFVSVGGDDKIPASRLYYIPNAWHEAGAFEPVAGKNPKQLGDIKIDPATIAATTGADVIDPTAVDYSKTYSATNVFDTTRGQVQYESVNVNGKDYPLRGSSNSSKLDLTLPVKQEIQKLPIVLNYSVVDNKATQDGQDDDTRYLSTGAGELRVYNLNYSSALVEVNEAAKENSASPEASVRNGLGFAGSDAAGVASEGVIYGYIKDFGNASGGGNNGNYGPFQVVGYQTPTLPDNGRAKYIGTSFGVNSTGRVELEADFGLDRAGISGSITQRENGAGVKLDDMVLKNIQLSQPSAYRRTASIGIDSTSPVGNGVVDLGGNQNWGTWAVKFFGPNAENAGGVIAEGVQTGAANLQNVVEAFDTARGPINKKSLNNPY